MAKEKSKMLAYLGRVCPKGYVKDVMPLIVSTFPQRIGLPSTYITCSSCSTIHQYNHLQFKTSQVTPSENHSNKELFFSLNVMIIRDYAYLVIYFFCYALQTPSLFFLPQRSDSKGNLFKTSFWDCYKQVNLNNVMFIIQYLCIIFKVLPLVSRFQQAHRIHSFRLFYGLHFHLSLGQSFQDLLRNS